MKDLVTNRIGGDRKTDDRGTVSFINPFSFPGIVRFYHVTNKNTKIIRAFHGHMKEQKYVYVVKGKILLCTVKLNGKGNPFVKAKVEKHILSEQVPSIFHIPAGYANGFRALEEDSHVIFFSTLSLKESLKDDFRFPSDYWGKDIWQ